MKDEAKIKSANIFPVVGIGASAGGLDAFKKLLKAIPENSGMAYVLVQHLDPKHESSLPAILQKVTSIPVLEISDDIKVQPNHIYVIPTNKMMVANDGILRLSPRPANSKTERNLPIDLFFTSLAEVHQSHAIGVVLSGTAHDGTLGLKAIKDNGGITFAQDEESAEYGGMPDSAVQAGVVDFILPPDKIPQKLLEITSILGWKSTGEQDIPQQDDEIFKQMLALLRIRKGTDFTYYKQTTIRRRILRRMALNKNEEPASYLTFLRENKTEQDALYQDMLIPVTAFFRDKKVFSNVCESVFPHIVKNKAAGETLRIWVAGCSTGEEAYSIAICFKEFIDSYSSEWSERVQIFATDLSEPAIAKARTGIYTKLELNAVSPQRLQEFFTKTNGSYQVNKQVRDMCVFAYHNFLKDPPFGKMDFISCRNVLIYMEPYLQKKALTTFHYSLNPKGFLLLGKSETTSNVPDLFTTADTTDKLFTRKNVPAKFALVASPRSEQMLTRSDVSTVNETIRTDFQKMADDIMLTKYTPAGVVINEDMDIVHFRGKTADFLEQASGKPTHNLLLMAKHGLAFELRSILLKSKKENALAIKENIPLQINGILRNVSIEVMPLPNTIEPHYLVLFHEAHNFNIKIQASKASSKTKSDDKDKRIRQLEQELAQVREDMRGITEEQEAANEELQSSNEELMSSSEELQSLNEELETSKEELQSTNEELIVVNQEIIGLNEQITAARNYAEAIIANIREPMLILDKRLRIVTANNSFYKTFGLSEANTEGVLIYDLGNKEWNIPALRTLLEKILPEKLTFNDFEVMHTLPGMDERIMMLNAREIINKNISAKLILLSIEDITEQSQSRKKIEENEHRYHEMVYSSPLIIAILQGEELILDIANDSILEHLGKGKDIIGKSYLVSNPELEEQGIGNILREVYRTGVPFQTFETPLYLIRNGKKESRYYNYLVQAQRKVNGEIEGIAIMATEVTPFVELNNKIKASEERFRYLVEQTLSPICIFKGKDMILEIANEPVFKIWNVGKEMVGKPFLEIVPEMKDQPFMDLLLDVFNNGITRHGSEWPAYFVRENGEKENLYFNFVFRPYREHDGTISGVFVFANDVTAQVHAKYKELENRVLREKELEEKVQQRTFELSDANEQLKKINAELASFTFVTSHDLQEPLRKIQTLITRLLDTENKMLSNKGKDYFNRIQIEADRMRTLILDLLAFSRIGEEERNFEKMDFGIIIEEVKSDCKEAIEEKKAVIKVIEVCDVQIVRFQFKQLLQNLITNALKFSRPQVAPYITISSHNRKYDKANKVNLPVNKSYCHICITDNGIGFEKEFSKKIFEVFQKLHGKDEYPGTGIGLAIVKKIVENHRGFITATSELGSGSTFDIYIPAE